MDYTDFTDVPDRTYQVILVDPPWMYWGDGFKPAAAAKHYSLMTYEDLAAMPVLAKCQKQSVIFMWATGPKLHLAVDLIREWGFFYRGIAFDWIKTKKDGTPIRAQGVRPSITKPLTELVIAGSTVEKGRPLPVLDEAVQQTVFACRGRHSAKPEAVRDRIHRLYGSVPRLEMFARGAPVDGWDRFGNQLDEVDESISHLDEVDEVGESILKMMKL